MRGSPNDVCAAAKMRGVSDAIEAGQLRWLMRLLQQAGTNPGLDGIILWQGMSLRNHRTALFSPGLWPFLAKQNRTALRSSAALRPTGSKAHAPPFPARRCPARLAIGA